MMAIIEMPVPPSINEARRVTRGRIVDTQAARDWKRYAGTEVRLQAPPRIADPAGVIVIANIDRRLDRHGRINREDADNRVKLMFDVLVREGVIEDDNLIAAFAIAWAPPHTRRARLAIFPARECAVRFHPSSQVAVAGAWIIPAANPEREAADAA